MQPKSPKIRRVQMPDPYVEGERAAERERLRILLARGRSSTILTGGGGDTSMPNIGISRLGGYGGLVG